MQSDNGPQLDEAVWKAWLEGNEAQDKVRYKRRVKRICFMAVFLALTALLWTFTS